MDREFLKYLINLHSSKSQLIAIAHKKVFLALQPRIFLHIYLLYLWKILKYLIEMPDQFR